MKRYLSKLTALMMVFLLLISLFKVDQPLLATNSIGPGTLKYNVQIITEGKNSDNTAKLDYWSGEQIMPRAAFDISGDGVNIRDAVAKITVPKIKVNNNLVIKKPTFVVLDSAKTSVESEDEDNWYMTYTFEVLRGGSVALALFPFNFLNNITPNGTQITVKYELFGENSTLLDKAEETYTAKTEPYDSRKIIDQHFSKANRTTVQGQQDVRVVRREEYRDRSAETHTPDTGWEVTYGVQIYATTSNNNMGVFSLTNSPIKLVDYLPAGATLSQKSIDDGWQYNAQNHTATWEGLRSSIVCVFPIVLTIQDGENR